MHSGKKILSIIARVKRKKKDIFDEMDEALECILYTDYFFFSINQ